jgi:outer membrane murein-binding lipoprotein Lpp
MAAARKDLLTRLADAGEDAISRLGDAPGMKGVTGFANTTRDRLDELTKKVRGIDALEKRVAKLEKRLNEMSGTKSTAKRTSATAKKTSARKTTTRPTSAKTGGDSPG